MFKFLKFITDIRHCLITLFLIGACIVPAIGNAAFKAPPQKMIQDSDQDGDGRISAEEWKLRGFNPKKFNQADGDGDGYLTLQELITFNQGDGAAGGGQPMPDRSAGMAAPGNVEGGKDPVLMIKAMDKDGDGRISKKEFLGPKQAFGHLDADGDGYVTLEEFPVTSSGAGSASPQMASHPNAGWYSGLPLILTHTHVVAEITRGKDNYADWKGTVARAIKEMDENGVQASIIMSSPWSTKNYSYFNKLVDIAKQYPTRFKVSGGGRSLTPMLQSVKADRVSEGDRADFIKRADELIAKGAVGFGETAALHFSMQNWHPFGQVRPDHPLYLLLADLAAKYDVPIDVHMEAIENDWTLPDSFHKRTPKNPKSVNGNIKAFERLLAHNSRAKIIWVHLGSDSSGQRSPALTRRLLQTYPNLYISITGSQHAKKYPLIIGNSQINPEWKELFMEFPDRFTIGADTFYQPNKTDRKMPQNIKSASKIIRLAMLPPDVTRKIAFENAQHLYKLTLIDPNDYPLPVSSAPVQPSKKSTIPILNGHVHIDHKGSIMGGAQKMIADMDKQGIQAAIIMSPPSQDRGNTILDSLLNVAGKYSGRFAVMGGGSLLRLLKNSVVIAVWT